LDRPLVCPKCLSQHEDIHGVIYVEGCFAGQCEDPWHRGDLYDPNVLDLTAEDRDFLTQQHIQWW